MARVGGWVGVLSALSAWSLILFGGLSLLVVCFSWTFAGALIGAALLVHGVLELWLRSRFLPHGKASVGMGLAWNQFALAGSVLLYLGWQLFSFDTSEFEAMLARDPIRSLLQQAPPEMTEMFIRNFVKVLASAYGIVGFLALIGCLGMALMYLRSRQK